MALHFTVVTKPNAGKGLQGARAKRGRNLDKVGLGSEGRWVEACLLAQPPAACRDAVLNSIAVHLPTEQHEQAVQLLLRVFEAVIQRSSSPYREALALVDEIGQRMDKARRTAWLTDLRTQYKVKRNFVRDLPER
jgi:hypothetical protein